MLNFTYAEFLDRKILFRYGTERIELNINEEQRDNINSALKIGYKLKESSFFNFGTYVAKIEISGTDYTLKFRVGNDWPTDVITLTLYMYDRPLGFIYLNDLIVEKTIKKYSKKRRMKGDVRIQNRREADNSVQN